MINYVRNYTPKIKFELPDIADFPDAGEPCCLSDQDCVDELYGMENALKSMDYNQYIKSHQLILNMLQNRITLDNQEIQILNEQTKRIHQFAKTFFSLPKQIPQKSSKEFDEFYENGCYPTNINDIQKIKKILEKSIDNLFMIKDHKSKPHFYDRSISWKPGQMNNLFEIINLNFSQNKIFELCRNYLNKNVSVQSITLHVSTPTDTHYNQTLSDMNTNSSLVGLHMDPKFNILKVIVYLSDVDIDSGPFSTIPGSWKWDLNLLESMVARGNSTGNYLDSPTKRKILLSMPKSLRKNIIIGRYILDGTEKSDMLKKQLHEYTTYECNSILFDPTNTFHRGGICNSKNRINLQVLLK